MNKYKNSVYNLLIEKDEKGSLMYNSHSGALFVLDETTENFLTSIKEDNNPERFTNFKALLENGYIVDENIDEFVFFKMKENHLLYSMMSTNVHYVICPTMSCNYNCLYCYEHENGKQFPIMMMSEDIIEKTLKFLKNQIEGSDTIKDVKVTWFGGEPLLGMDVVEEISRDLIFYCQKKNIGYHASIITNGLLFDKEMAKKCSEKLKIRMVQITIDGAGEVYKEYKGTTDKAYDKVIENVIAASKYMRVNVRLNVDKNNYSSVVGVVKMLITKQGVNENIKFYLAPIKVQNSNVLAKYMFSDEEFYNAKVKFWEMLIENKYYGFVENEIPQMKYISCGALSRNNYIVDPMGDLYKCERTIGEKRYCIGNVEEGLFYNTQTFVFGEYNVDAKCKKCAIYPVCRAGCRKECIEGKTVDCESKINEVKRLLKYKYHIISGNI